MSPLITTKASASAQAYGLFSPALVTGNFQSIQTVTVGSSGSSTITFSSIPQTLTHLQIRGFVQTNRSTYGIDEGYLTFNSDSSTNYGYHYFYGDGSSVTAGASPSVTRISTGSGNFGTSTGGTFGGFICDILDYSNTNKNKTIRMFGSTDINGTVGGLGARINFSSGFWLTTSAINSFTLVPVNSSLFTQYSSFALYGVK